MKNRTENRREEKGNKEWVPKKGQIIKDTEQWMVEIEGPRKRKEMGNCQTKESRRYAIDEMQEFFVILCKLHFTGGN